MGGLYAVSCILGGWDVQLVGWVGFILLQTWIWIWRWFYGRMAICGRFLCAEWGWEFSGLWLQYWTVSMMWYSRNDRGWVCLLSVYLYSGYDNMRWRRGSLIIRWWKVQVYGLGRKEWASSIPELWLVTFVYILSLMWWWFVSYLLACIRCFVLVVELFGSK